MLLSFILVYAWTGTKFINTRKYPQLFLREVFDRTDLLESIPKRRFMIILIVHNIYQKLQTKIILVFKLPGY